MEALEQKVRNWRWAKQGAVLHIREGDSDGQP